MNNMTDIQIHTEYITLSQLLKFSGIAETGGQADWAIREGEVLVNGEVCTMRGKKLRDGDTAAYNGVAVTVKTNEG